VSTVLLDRSPVQLERLDVAAGRASAWREHGAGESFLYVIAGEGAIELADGPQALAAESVVWLEPGDRYRLAAAEDGLAVLAATVKGGAAT
jgi:quercetin dioxygenase-like cupin family protein